jgi:hypothetical protein
MVVFSLRYLLKEEADGHYRKHPADQTSVGLRNRALPRADGGERALTLGTQNQVVDFILAGPELRRVVSDWAQGIEIDEATTDPPSHLPGDNSYQRISAYLQSVMNQPVFTRPGQPPGDWR